MDNSEYNEMYQTIYQHLSFLHPNHRTFEIRIIEPKVNKSPLWCNQWVNNSVSGYFNDIDLATKAIIEVENTVNPRIIATSVNSCPEIMLSRANNKFLAKCPALKDTEIEVVNNILIDIDPVRISGVSANDVEKAHALTVAKKLVKETSAAGFPDPLMSDSGNGYHVVFKVGELSQAEEKRLVKDFTEFVAENYSDDRVKVDTTVASPAHLARVSGTMNRKGEDMPDRPHRRSAIYHSPNIVSEIPKERLEDISQKWRRANSPDATTIANRPIALAGNQRAKFNLAMYLAHYGIPVTEVKKHGSSTLYVLEKCLFDPNHGKNEACIIQREDGTLLYQCFHNSCRFNRWADAKQAISGQDSLNPFMEGGNPAVEPLLGTVVSMDELIHHQFPATVPLIENLVSVGGATVIAGPGGVGKSNLTMNLALGVASPHINSFLDLSVVSQGRVMIVQAENAAADTKDRLALISQNPAFQAGLQGVFSPTHGLSDIRILDGDLNHDPFFERIIEDCLTLGIALLIIDPLISFHRGDENDNSSMRRTLDRLTTIMSITGVAIILVHHVGKDIRAGNSSFSGRGASAIGDWAHNTFLLQVSDPKNEILELKCQKARNFKKPESIFMRLNSNLIFERLYPKAIKKPNLQVIVTSAMQKLNGKASSQTDLINAIIACSPNMAKSKARSIIKEAVADGLIKETQNQRNQEYLLIAN